MPLQTFYSPRGLPLLCRAPHPDPEVALLALEDTDEWEDLYLLTATGEVYEVNTSPFFWQGNIPIPVMTQAVAGMPWEGFRLEWDRRSLEVAVGRWQIETEGTFHAGSWATARPFLSLIRPETPQQAGRGVRGEALDNAVAALQDKWRGDLYLQFAEFHRQHPHVYFLLLEACYRYIDRGDRVISISRVCEDVRGDHKLGLPNVLRAGYGMLLRDTDPRIKARMRVRRHDQAPFEATRREGAEYPEPTDA